MIEFGLVWVNQGTYRDRILLGMGLVMGSERADKQARSQP